MLNNKSKLYACFLDLKRSAMFFYKNPKGNTFKVFLANTLDTLNTIPNKNLDKFKSEIKNLQKLTSKKEFTDEEKMRLADDILTTGILLKSL